jgi:hypothetical protein
VRWLLDRPFTNIPGLRLDDGSWAGAYHVWIFTGVGSWFPYQESRFGRLQYWDLSLRLEILDRTDEQDLVH